MVTVPDSAAARAMARACSWSPGPSSIPGRTWEWMSTYPSTARLSWIGGKDELIPMEGGGSLQDLHEPRNDARVGEPRPGGVRSPLLVPRGRHPLHCVRECPWLEGEDLRITGVLQ